MRLFLGKPIGRDALLATVSTPSLNFASHSRKGDTFSRILHQLISSKKVAAALAGVEAIEVVEVEGEGKKQAALEWIYSLQVNKWLVD